MLNNLINQLFFGNYVNNEATSNNVDNVDGANSMENEQKFDFIDRNDIDWVLVNPFNSKKFKHKNNYMSMSTSDYGLRNLLEQQVPEDELGDERCVTPIQSDEEIYLNKKEKMNCSSSSSSSVNNSSDKTSVKDDSLSDKMEQERWLITPLPSLVSITTSQRSIVDSGIENLLIEHPSMSVFISATCSNVEAVVSDNHMINKKHENLVESEQKNEVKLRNKKHRDDKAKVKTNNNKENENAKLLLNGSTAATTASSPASQNKTKRLIAASANKNNAVNKIAFRNSNQMRLNNKIQRNTYLRDVNTRQRKYHKLQQPQFWSGQIVQSH